MGEVTVKVKNVRKQFGAGHTRVVAVKDVSMAVQRGEVVLVVGPSGSGKTTLLSMVGGILTPTSGEIFLEEERISGASREELAAIRREYIGFVFQGFNLLKSLTAAQNVEVALNLNGVKGKTAGAKAEEILEEIGLGDRLGYYPVDMSWGERQRVSIARALVNRPKIVLADEPTGNLDSKTGQKVAAMLRELAKEQKTSLIVVTHDTRLGTIADRVIHLEDGLIISDSG